MRVLVYEQEFLGHHFDYLAHMLPGLADLVEEVIVAITPMASGSPEYRTALAPLADRVDIQAVLPPGDPTLRLRSRGKLLQSLRDAVRRYKPDYVLVPSADGQTSAMGLYRAAGRRGLPGGVPGEAGIHYGYGCAGLDFKSRLKDLFYIHTQEHSSWKRIHYVNLNMYNRAIAAGGSLSRRAELLPHPVPTFPRAGKREARRRLGIPEEGRYLGLLAVIDRRKAIDRLLPAFRSAAGPSDRLLLAGRMDEAFSRLIAREYSDLVKAGRLIALNRYIDAAESHAVLNALDVVCVPYPRFPQLSSAMLHGVAAGKPVLASDFGWMHSIIGRFGCGWTCDILDPASFARGIRAALEGSETYQENEATRRMLEFHSPENFAESWLRGIREAKGLPPSGRTRSWAWVLEAFDGVGESVGAGSG